MRNKFVETFMPFLIVGFAIALMVGLFFIIANVLVWGFVIAGVLWLAVTARVFFLKKFGTAKTGKKHKGVIIEHDRN